MKISSQSKIQTQKIAKELAITLRQAQGIKKQATVILLHGDLGAGKTTFTQGFLRGLGVRSKITSPTFVLMKNYKLPFTNYSTVYHIDCYRIKSPKEILGLGWKELISNPKNIVLIEWPEKISKILPKNKIRIIFKHGPRENIREIMLK